MTTNYIEVTQDERRAVEAARDALHEATLAVLKAHGQDSGNRDITELGEAIALEGVIQFEN